MSETTKAANAANINNEKFFYHSAGVIKFDYKSAGYKDVLKIAKERAKDEGFYHIVVRFVSEHNLGIQFAYATTDPSKDKRINKLKDELLEKYGKGKNTIYARDIGGTGGKGKKAQERFEDLQNELVVSKEMPIKNL